MQNQELSAEISEHDLVGQRKAKLAALRKQGNAYPNDFKRDSLAAQIHQQFSDKDPTSLESNPTAVKVAGRILLRRLMGKASFLQLQDMSGKIQIYVRQADIPEGVYEDFLHWDIGDIVGVEGVIFKTKTGELSVKASKIVLLSKALRPLPDKFHGLSDQELRFRKRYLDLIMNEESKNVFFIRTKIIEGIRSFLNNLGFLEVETPMMQVLPGGAAARPFITHHNTLDMDLYLRIAPELYLKRLVVGGFEKVYEINRNFRNEGISTRHNPEFTMLEFYQAYATYDDLMDLTEQMLRKLALEVLGTTTVTYQNEQYDLAKPFIRMTLKESILHFNPDITAQDISDLTAIRNLAKRLQIPVKDNYGVGKIQFEIFEKTVEQRLKSPTFITAFPTEVSPLARCNDHDPFITDRFEFFLGGREIANGFSELNDPEEQAARFMQQAKEKEAGEEEAMCYDADYILALEHGMPPTAGEGIGIDRLVMFLTDCASIREVLLFPLLRQ